MFFIIIFSLLFSFSQVDAKTCQSAFAFENLHYQLEKNSHSKGNVLLIHGLGDNLSHLDKISKEFKDQGYTVLRVDLHGHGKNLEKWITENKKIPAILPVEDNVRDLVSIIKSNDFRRPIIIGHSYGGAVAYSLANALRGTPQQPKSVILMAPYLRRLDYSLLTGNPLIDMQTEYMTEQYMRRTYREYFESQKRENIDELVDASIAATKGIRSFDVLSYGKKAALQFSVPFLVIGGSKDDLVKYDQIDTFHEKLLSEKYNHKVVYLEGDHFFPHVMSKETFKLIIDFLKH